jgi:hypothetical protein
MSAQPERQRLPNRRLIVTQVVHWSGQTWLASIGFDKGGKAREVFFDGVKSGGQLEGLLDDACVLLSLLLQSGWHPDSLAARMGGGDGPEASPIGAVAWVVAKLEDQSSAGIRDAYAAADALALRRAPE